MRGVRNIEDFKSLPLFVFRDSYLQNISSYCVKGSDRQFGNICSL
jgi:hypothetical protein